MNKRDFLFVEDVCDLYLCLSYNLAKDKSLRGEVFNAGTGSGYKVKDIVKKAGSTYGTSNKIAFNPVITKIITVLVPINNPSR